MPDEAVGNQRSGSRQGVDARSSTLGPQANSVPWKDQRPSLRSRLIDVRPLHVLVAATVLVFLGTWIEVLIGTTSLVGLDLLYQARPWEFTEGAHRGRNTIVWDPVQAFYPWLVITREALLSGQLPLWDSLALSGRPLLANGISAVFSPFTLIALPFAPPTGMSIGFLAKMWVAGLGMAAYLRTLKCSGLAATVGGIAFATCSFLVVWLAWPQSSVAALMPWAFAGVEGYVRERRRSSLVITAVAVALQFLGGHAETSLHLGVALGLYAAIRVAGFWRHSWPLLRNLVLAGIVGTLLAGIHLVPFLDYVPQTTIAEDRGSNDTSATRLELTELSSWLVPNGLGSPAIDGVIGGRLPNFNEATGFVGIGMLMVAPLGACWAWRRERGLACALVALVLLSAGIVYGPLTVVAAHTPGLALSANQRFLLVLCFALIVFGALGVEALVRRGRIDRARDAVGVTTLGLGVGAIAGLLACRAILARAGAGVNDIWPSTFGLIGFWELVAALSALAAMQFLLSGLMFGRGPAAAIGMAALALAEAALFAGTFNPQVPLSEIPPRSAVVDWLRANAGDGTIVGLETILIPESLSIYGLRDARGIDPLQSSRLKRFWAKVDPDYDPSYGMVMLHRPDVRWLAVAGVSYVVAWGDAVLPGTTSVLQMEGVTVARVDSARPFASVAVNPVFVPTIAEALQRLSPDGTVVESIGGIPPLAAGSPAGQSSVAAVSRSEGAVDLSVHAEGPATVVLLQAFSPGWEATIDGVPTSIRPANVLFQAITVPAGAHHVSALYRPASVPLGACVSWAGLIGLLVLAKRSSSALWPAAVLKTLWSKRIKRQS